MKRKLFITILELVLLATTGLFMLGFTMPGQAEVQLQGAGTHKIWVNYYKAFIYDNHELWPFEGEWYFDLYADGAWVGEVGPYGRDDNEWADFSDRNKSWYFSASTWFKCWAGEEDGWPIPYWDSDAHSYRTVNIGWPWPTTNKWHDASGLGNSGKGAKDVRHYCQYYIENKAPTVGSISGPDSGAPPVTYTYTTTGDDPEGDSITYEWSVNGVKQLSASSSLTYTFNTAGTYTIRVRTKDYFGRYSAWSLPKTVSIAIVKIVTNLNFWFTPNPAKPGETVQLKGTLKTLIGIGVYPAQVRVEYSTDGGATWKYIWTLNTWPKTGQFSKTFGAPGVGSYLVKASYAGSATYNPSSDTETLTVQPGKVNTVLNLWFTPNPVNPGQTVQLKGTLKTVGGSAVYPAQVRVEYSTNGGITWHFYTNLNTNPAGEFSKTFGAPGVGSYLVKASYAGSATYNPSSDTETLTVQ